MKKPNTFLFYLLAIIVGTGVFSPFLHAEDTGMRVYNIAQTRCTNGACHNSTTVAGGLDLQGTGFNPAADVYANIYNIATSNPTALAKNNKLIYPGDPYRSFMFRLVGQSISGDISLDESEDPGNIHRNLQMPDLEREIIRQWILYGAPATGEVVSHDMLAEFYAGNGVWSIDPQSPPPAPASNGFQIHVGPIFLPAWTSGDQPNLEYMTKYETLLPTGIEINRTEVFLGNSSHHFIIYKFNDMNTANNMQYGFRPVFFSGVDMVAAYQGSASDVLPEGTAFRWQNNTILNLNPHVTNYSSTAIVACDIYLNVTTQTYGTAAQEMKSQLLPNLNINIPGDGTEHGFETALYTPFPLPFFPATMHVWKMASHTHQRATDFDVWLRNTDGTKGIQVYDAKRWNGVPDCEEIPYDYQHPPSRVFSPFLTLNSNTGIIHRGKYVNCSGCPSVGWGETTNDEMMITGVLYVESTNGVVFPEPSVCYAQEVAVEQIPINAHTPLSLSFSPNPLHQSGTLLVKAHNSGTATLQLFDLQGKLSQTMPNLNLQSGDNSIGIETDLPKGVYVAVLTNQNGYAAHSKLLVQ
jgi:hypothetical protein